MKITEVIEKIKQYHYGYIPSDAGEVKINDSTSRDKILFGNPDQECTGIVTTCWASMDVINRAVELKANLIICHEALFWNHGDHTEWLKNNTTFLNKQKLLSDYGIVVWRNHDYVHSGIPLKSGNYVDGIFYGLAKELGWDAYIDERTSVKIDRSAGWNGFSLEKKLNPLSYVIPEMTVKELSEYVIEKLNLNGVKVIGNLNKKVKKVSVPFHVLGDANAMITLADQGAVDCFFSMEIVDFTLMEYVRDCSMDHDGVSMISMGHFNIEEPGMKHMVSYIKEILDNQISCVFVQSGDNYQYITS